ncbi:MAG: pyridoxal phosphate-dependent aminotransferase [Deltaproteobacteria bacterium]|nr:pyridoxal phosphate-dependent aminotransferase [Deltaproteobacteria bacterium]
MGKSIRHSIVGPTAGKFKYEIREIVALANELRAMGLDIIFENIGDPIHKGEMLPDWMKEIVVDLVRDDDTWGYTATQGDLETRKFLCARTNARGGVHIRPEDIIFFNGLGDAVARMFGSMKREARIIGPSPAYPTHSSAESAHSGYDHVTYDLMPDDNWNPNLEEIEKKIKYNDTIAGILVINPGNPTGAVYSRQTMETIVDIARRYGVMVIADEIYQEITYNGAHSTALGDIIEEVPGISLKGISKEFPWPGGRCGWFEVYNQHTDRSFREYIDSIVHAKMLEVCSTSLPQRAIPLIMGDQRYPAHLERRRRMFEARTNEACDIFSKVRGIRVIRPQGAFYMSVVFEDGVLNDKQTLRIRDSKVQAFIETRLANLELDKRFVYYLLAARGICVVPLTGFCCTTYGFRITTLECDDEKRVHTWNTIADAIDEYLNS